MRISFSSHNAFRFLRASLSLLQISYLPLVHHRSIMSYASSAAIFLLPVEIRIQIYTYSFQPNGPEARILIGHSSPVSSAAPLIPPLCQVNRQLYNEALPIYFLTAQFTPWRPDLLPILSTKLESLAKRGMNNVKSLDLSRFSTYPSDAELVLRFTSHCTKLQHLSLNLDCTIYCPPLSTTDICHTFQLSTLLELTSLRTFYITVQTSPPSPPPAPELEGLLGLVQMQRRKKISGLGQVDRAVVGNRRLYTFIEGNEIATREVREWFRKQWLEMGRDIEVLTESN